jgi:hypothetical protein
MTQPFPTSPIVGADTATNATTASGTITRAGRALGIMSADIAADAKSVPWSFSGASTASGTQVLDKDNLENLGTLAQFANTVAAGEAATGAISLTLDLTALTAGEGEGLEIRQPDSNGRIVSGLGQSFHSDSSVLIDNDGATVRVDVELGTNRLFLTRNGVLLGEIGEGRPGGELDPQERYHTAVCLVRTTNGYVSLFTDHNKRAYFVASTTLQGLVDDNEPTAAIADGDCTYLRCFADGDTVYLQTRFRVGGSESYVGVAYITDPYGSPTVTTRYITGSTTYFHYPRAFTPLRGTGGAFDGVLLVGIVVQMRTSSGPWRGFSAVVWNPATDDVWAIDGTKVDTGAGTSTAAPMVVGTTFYTDVGSNASTIVSALGGGSPTGNRYIADNPLIEIVTWDDSTKTAAVLTTLTDTANTDANAYQAADVRLLSQVGGTRYVTTAASNPLGVSSARSYRIPASFIGGKLHIIDQPNGGELESQPAVLYYHFGGERYQTFSIGDWKAANGAVALAAAFTSDSNAITLPGPSVNIKAVLNSTAVYMDLAAPLGTLKNQTMRPGMLWSPTINIGFQEATGGSRSRARYNRAR